MKKIIVGLLLFSLLCSLCACRSSEYVGVYHGLYVETAGESYRIEDYFNGENYLELKKNGKAEMVLNGSVHALKWKEDHGTITFKESGDEFYGYLGNGVIQLDYQGWGLNITFILDGVPVPETTVQDPEARAQAMARIAEYWNGDWYGWWEIIEGTGVYADAVGIQPDIWGKIELTDGRGDFTIGELGKEELLAQTILRVDPDSGDPEMGIGMSGQGSFCGTEIQAGDWLIDPSKSTFDNLLEVSGYYADAYGDFFYVLYLRPWGTSWEDVQAAIGTDATPGGLPAIYESYLEAAQSGQTMDEFLDSLVRLAE